MNRRGFLGAIMAAAAAPAIVKAGSLMRINPSIIVPDGYLDAPAIFDPSWSGRSLLMTIPLVGGRGVGVMTRTAHATGAVIRGGVLQVFSGRPPEPNEPDVLPIGIHFARGDSLDFIR